MYYFSQRREVIRLLILRYLAKRSCQVETGTELSDVEKDNEDTLVTPEQNPKISQSDGIATINATKL